MGGGDAGDRAVMIRGLAESWPPHRLAYAPALLPGGEKNKPLWQCYTGERRWRFEQGVAARFLLPAREKVAQRAG